MTENHGTPGGPARPPLTDPGDTLAARAFPAGAARVADPAAAISRQLMRLPGRRAEPPAPDPAERRGDVG